jgi:hypothetical protein
MKAGELAASQPGEGIPLSATVDGDKLIVEGTWVEHLTECPSKKDIAQAHRVRITGKITPKNPRDNID